ncbi:MAG: hypothetical protein ACJAW8_001615 [Oleispira sp.]|jgi:hypothetical protein
MDVLGNPILTFSALSLIIILLGISFLMLRARMILLERQVLEMDETVLNELSELQGVIESSFSKSGSESRKNTEELLKGILEKVEASKKDVVGCVQESQKVTDSSVSKLLGLNEQKVTGLISAISDNVGAVAENVKNNAVYTKGVVERTGMKVSEEISNSGKELIDQLQSTSKNITTAQSKALAELNAVHSDVISKIEKSVHEQTNEVLSCLNETASDTKELVKESTDALSDTIELVRVSNVLTENRNLYDQGRLVLETEAFVKTFDSCQLTQIEDKETGQVTKNEFQNGKISTSKTYRTDSLEYVGHYEDGILKKMEDLTGPEGSNITQYEYDEAGEVESVI